MVVVRATTADRRSLAQHPATWMRWELLPLAESLSHGAPPLSVVLQLGAKEPSPPRLLDARGLRILLMAFPPEGVAVLDYEREEEEMLTALAPLVEKGRARMRVVEEGTLDELKNVLLLDAYNVAHLTGHGTLTPDGPRLAAGVAGRGRGRKPPGLLDRASRRGSPAASSTGGVRTPAERALGRNGTGRHFRVCLELGQSLMM